MKSFFNGVEVNSVHDLIKAAQRPNYETINICGEPKRYSYGNEFAILTYSLEQAVEFFEKELGNIDKSKITVECLY